MLEFWNVVAAAIAALVLGMAIHSAYRHTFDRKKRRKRKEGDEPDVGEEEAKGS
jgi:hypothetical protein